jgi:hypothetical protein
VSKPQSYVFGVDIMASSLREDEKFVIKALCNTYGGTWRDGEDPPDAYLSLSDGEVAVEISILTQHVAVNQANKFLVFLKIPVSFVFVMR